MQLFSLTLARRYIFSGKNAIEVNLISWVAFLSLGFVTSCLLIILSVFSGLEDINIQFYSNISPDIKIEAAKGKSIKEASKEINKIRNIAGISTISPVVEERAFIDYRGKTHIINIRGISPNYNQIFGLDTLVKFGRMLDFGMSDEIIIGTEVSSRLSLYTDEELPVRLYVPKPGKGIIQRQEEAFSQVEAFSVGIFMINDNFNNTIFSSIDLAQNLLGFSPDQVSYLALKTEGDNSEIQQEIANRLGNEFKIYTKTELNAAFMKMINTENLIIYLILILILVIASFNLAGSVAILILNKRRQSKTLVSLGMPVRALRSTFFGTGFLISVYALIFGLALGSIVVFIQWKFGVVGINEVVAFPVKISWVNYLITVLSVLGIGSAVSWLVSRYVRLD